MKIIQRTSFTCFIALVAFLGSCRNKCEEFDMMPEFDQLQNISGVNEIDLDCIDYETIPITQVVQSDSVYRNMLDTLVGHNPYCDLDELPEIDFDTKTLIWASTAHTIVDKLILKDENVLTFLLKIKTSRFADAHLRMNAVTVPKLSATDTVVFKIVTYGYDCE
jgi:hypothetical protein